MNQSGQDSTKVTGEMDFDFTIAVRMRIQDDRYFVEREISRLRRGKAGLEHILEDIPRPNFY